jgi:hypothetical protein
MNATASKIVSLFKKPGKKRRRNLRVAEPQDKPRRVWIEGKDVFLFGGLALSGYGVWQIYPPSAYVLVGGAFLAIGVLIYMGDSK